MSTGLSASPVAGSAGWVGPALALGALARLFPVDLGT